MTTHSVAPIEAGSAVGALVREQPSISRKLDDLGIDYCCGGHRTLAEACAQQRLDLNATLEALRQWSPPEQPSPGPRPVDLSLTELSRHIEGTHHAYLHSEMPRLQMLAAKVARVHGQRDPQLVALAAVVEALAADLETHLAKEEQILFPLIRRLEAGEDSSTFHGGSVAAPIKRLELEHDQAGTMLSQLRQLSADYSIPDWACGSYRALIEGLRHLEADMHQHVHKENNVLFLRAIALEQQQQQRQH